MSKKDKVYELCYKGYTIREIARDTGLSKSTVWRYIKELIISEDLISVDKLSKIMNIEDKNVIHNIMYCHGVKMYKICTKIYYQVYDIERKVGYDLSSLINE